MAQVQQDQHVESTANSCQNSDTVVDKTKESSEATLNDSAHDSTSTGQNQSNKDTFEVSDVNQKQDTNSHPSKNISHAVMNKNATTRINFYCRPQETKTKIVDYNETGNMDVSADDFGNTFLLDEEIELEQKMPKKTELSSTGRYLIVLSSDL